MKKSKRRVHFEAEKQLIDSPDELHPLLQWDMDIVMWLVKKKEETPWLKQLVHSTTSRNRVHDISLLIWLVFLVMLPEFGFPYLWICIGNLLAVITLQYAAQILRPIDINDALSMDNRHADPDTFGFPCVDCHMAMVVLLPSILHTQSTAIRLLFVAIILYIGVMKLLLAVRFTTQVTGSWLTGFTGILLGTHGHGMVQAYRLTRGYKYKPGFTFVCVSKVFTSHSFMAFMFCCSTAAIVVLIVFLMFVLGMWIENNDSRLIGVPKQDFMDVLTNILTSDAPTPTPSSTSASKTLIHHLPDNETQSLRTTTKQRDDDDEEEQLAGRKDSFYFLMQGMRNRARQRRDF